MRVHTSEKPFIVGIRIHRYDSKCPMKSCLLRFSVRSNCVAHGKTKHLKSVVPVVLDITKGDTEALIMSYLSDDFEEDGEIFVVRKVGSAMNRSSEHGNSDGIFDLRQGMTTSSDSDATFSHTGYVSGFNIELIGRREDSGSRHVQVCMTRTRETRKTRLFLYSQSARSGVRTCRKRLTRLM
jgi:hypothetical protein